MDKDLIIKFVEKFVKFYDVIELQDISFFDCNLMAIAVWNDVLDEDNFVKFYWKIIYRDDEIVDLIEIIGYIQDNNLAEFDKILISNIDLKEVFLNKGWTSDKFDITSENLYKIEMPMVEEGEVVGCFYLHQ